MKIKTQGLKNLWDSIKAVLRGSACIYSNTSLPQETRKTWNRQPKFTLSLTIATKGIEYLGINLTEDTKTLY